MPVWVALTGTLGYNVHRHLRHRSTLCSSARKYVSAPLFVAAWAGLTGWIIPHYIGRRARP